MSEQGGGSSGEGVRLQKALAGAGVASRRVSEELIVAGRVRVNGRVVTELGSRVDPASDLVDVDGVAVQFDTESRYVMLNKPTGVVSTMRDEQGRPDLRHFTQAWPERLYNVGRLDAETSGLLVLTNDGALAHVLAHPSFGVTKVYIAKVRGRVLPATVSQLLRGVELDDGPIAPDKVRLLDAGGARGDEPGSSLVELTLHSGRNRIVRRMMAAVGHPVIELVRRQFGPLHLGTLPAGRARELTRLERGALLTLARATEAGDADAAAKAHAAAGGSTRPDRARPDQTRSDRARADRVRSDRAGSDRAGPDHAGPDHASPAQPRNPSRRPR